MSLDAVQGPRVTAAMFSSSAFELVSAAFSSTLALLPAYLRTDVSPVSAQTGFQLGSFKRQTSGFYDETIDCLFFFG